MAFLKIIIMAVLPFVAMPLVSTNNATLHSGSRNMVAAASASTAQNPVANKSRGSTIYKTENEFPEFMKKMMELESAQPSFAPDYISHVTESRKYLEV
jgi:hypothetical protein